MQKWEYKIESFGISVKSEKASKVDTYITFERAKALFSSDITQKKEQLLSENGLEVLCNKWGSEGWELVQIVSLDAQKTGLGHKVNRVDFVFKRLKKDNK